MNDAQERTAQKRLSGMTGFTVVITGQIISVLASMMTNFALSIWLWEHTHKAMGMAAVNVAFIIPMMVMSPIAGAFVDRYDRKLMMMISDLTAVLATVMIFILYLTGALEVWHIYVAAVINGFGNAFQWPAYSAVISTMVPKEQYSRANGMMSLVEAGPGVFAPMIASAVLPIIGTSGILLIDIITFGLAVGALLIVHIPSPEQTVEGQSGKKNLLTEAFYGFPYIFKRPSLLGLQTLFLFGNLFTGITFATFAPMVLSRSNDNYQWLASVQTAGAVGGIAGGLLMSAWKGFKKYSTGVILGWASTGLLITALGFSSTLWVWLPMMAIQSIAINLINTSNQALWQSKVAPDAQGRVFAARRLIAMATQPIAPLIGGLLADQVLEPGMATETSSLFKIFSPWVGTGPGSGMAILFVIGGFLIVAVGIVGFSIPQIRNVEEILPDHDQLAKAELEGANG